MLVATSCTPNSEINVIETESKSEIEAEEIFINNCGGSEPAEQTTQRSEVIEVENTTQVGLNADAVLYAQITEAYKNVHGVIKSHTVSASPKTNMHFVLLWTQQVNNGYVELDREQTKVTYKIKAPISVEQAVAEDKGCLGINSFDSPNMTPVNVQEFEFQVKAQTATWGPLETGIYIHQGDYVEISYVSGSWWIGKVENNRWISQFPVGADGYSNDNDLVGTQLGVSNPDRCRPMLSAPFGGLIGSVGKYKEMFYIGRFIQFVSNNSDLLFLRINYSDHNQFELCPYGDGGSITVKVKVLSP